MTFDATTLAGKTITDEKLELWNRDGMSYGCGATGSGIKAQRVTSPWTDLALRWHNQPASTSIGEAVAQDPEPCQDDVMAPDDVMWTWSVTSIVQAWAAGEPNYGLLLRGVGESATTPEYDRGFDASEVNGVPNPHPPILRVTYTESGSPGTPSPSPSPSPSVEPDTTPPTVLSVEPADESENVSPNAKVKVTFSEPVSDVDFSLIDFFSEGSVPGARTMSADGRVLTFTPGAPLDFLYGAEVGGARDAAGNTMTEPFSWMFMVGSWLQSRVPSAEASPDGKARTSPEPSLEKVWARATRSADGTEVSQTTTPQLMARMDGWVGRGSKVEVEIGHDPSAPAQGKGLIWGGSSGFDLGGQVGTVQVPFGKLQAGWKTRYRARASSLGVTGEWSDWRNLNIGAVDGDRSRTKRAATAAVARTYSSTNFKYDRIKDNDDCESNGRSQYGMNGNGVIQNKKGYARNRFSYCVMYMAQLVEIKYDRRGKPVRDSSGLIETSDEVFFPISLIGRTWQGLREVHYDLWVDDPIVLEGDYFDDVNFTFGIKGTGFPNLNACLPMTGGSIKTSYTGDDDYWDDRTVQFKFESYVDANSGGADNPELIGTCTTRVTLGVAGASSVKDAMDHPLQTIRCDSATYVGYHQGCIFDHEMPSIALKEAQFPNAYAHIQCDEYPFASTYEGAWVWWQENPPNDVRNYQPRGVNYTVKLIPAGENNGWGGRGQGGILYYYAYDRMLDGDAFLIRLYDKTGKRINP